MRSDSVIELDELSTFAWSLDTLRLLKHPLDPNLYPKIVGYTAKVSIEVRIVISSKSESRSGKSARVRIILIALQSVHVILALPNA